MPTNQHMMSTPACEKCGLYTCIHKDQLTQPITDVSLGETVGDKVVVEDVSVKIRVSDEADSKKRIWNIQCKNCGKQVDVSDVTHFCCHCGKPLNDHVQQVIKVTETKKETSTKKSKDKDKDKNDDVTIKCSYCDMDVMKKYITQHIKTHINDYVPQVIDPAIADDATSSDIQVTPESKPFIPIEASLISSLSDKDEVSLKSVDPFQYKEIVNISASASSSKDNRIFDFTVMVWLKARTSTYSTHYAGSGSWEHSKEFERVVITTTFDAIDEYYSVSVKLVKQNQYSSFSNDEAVPERLCFDQTEICQEIKKALLFFRVPPRSVYKRFLKIMRNDNLIIERNKDGQIDYVQTENENDLFAQLKAQQITSKHAAEAWRGYCG